MRELGGTLTAPQDSLSSARDRRGEFAARFYPFGGAHR
jgi:hypothetical protein